MALSRKPRPSGPVVTQSVPVSSGSTPVQINMIGRGTAISGELRAKSDTSISGKIEGKVIVEGRLIITADGLIEGEIHATHADIGGRVNGDVFVKERLALKGTCVVDGNVHTNKLVIEDGAVFTGKVVMGQQQKVATTTQPQQPAPQAPPTSNSTGSNRSKVPPAKISNAPMGNPPPSPEPAPNPVERRLSS